MFAEVSHVHANAATTVRQLHLHPLQICEACYTDFAHAADQRPPPCERVPPAGAIMYSALRRPRVAAGNAAVHCTMWTTFWPQSRIHKSSATSSRGGMHVHVKTNSSGRFYRQDGQDVSLTLLKAYQLSRMHEKAVCKSVQRYILAAK